MCADRAVSALLLLAVAACGGRDLPLGDGNPGLDASRPVADSSEPVADAGTPPADAAEPDVPFGEPRVIAELSGADSSDDDPSLSEDRLLLCFNSKRDEGEGAEDIWCTSRAAVTAPWQPPTPLTDLNTERRETGIALSLDGLTLWFSSDRQEGDDGLDVYVATRESRNASWSEPARVPQLSSSDDDLVSAVDQTARKLLLARRASDDEDYDVWIAERATLAEPWQPPQPITGINTNEEESDAFLVGGGASLLFTRDEDLVLARRATPDGPFDSGEPLAALNSDADDRDAWANAALTYVVFSSDRDGSHKLYEAERRR
jgi:hypothetical protein